MCSISPLFSMKKLSIVLGVVLLFVVALVLFGDRIGFDPRAYVPGIGDSESSESEPMPEPVALPTDTPCGDSAPECNGICPGTQVCVTPAYDGEPGCWCGEPCQTDDDCSGGLCQNGVCSNRTCGLYGIECGGTCADGGTCSMDLAGECRCGPTVNCGDSAPECNGLCAAGYSCVSPSDPEEPGCQCLKIDERDLPKSSAASAPTADINAGADAEAEVSGSASSGIPPWTGGDAGM